MKNAKLDDMIKGWFVGNFSPTVFPTEQCEVAVKHYRAGDKEAKHYHKIATEITVVISGKICMLDQEWSDGDIICLSPGEATSFHALTDVVSVVVKLPGALNDKFISEDDA